MQFLKKIHNLKRASQALWMPVTLLVLVFITGAFAPLFAEKPLAQKQLKPIALKESPQKSLLQKLFTPSTPAPTHLAVQSLPHLKINAEDPISGFFGKNPDAPILPLDLPAADRDGYLRLLLPNGQTRQLTIVSELQNGLQKFLHDRGNPIASVVMVEAKTGNILAMAQGRHPSLWQSRVHTALYAGFPAASLFKLVSATAALQVAGLDPNEQILHKGGCSDIHPRGLWLADLTPRRFQKMTLSQAFASSCNSFFAELVIKRLGLGVVNKFADKFAWGRKIPADFSMLESPIYAPTAETSTIHTVGMFAAGFGMVGLSAMHAAWLNLMIANDGQAMPLHIFQNEQPSQKLIANPLDNERLMDSKTSFKLRHMMNATVRTGTARLAFHKRGYRPLIELVGGKTGTLNGDAPKGQTTWFAGLMPIDSPEVIVSSIVVNDGRVWFIKGSQLAAEAFKLYYKYSADQRAKNFLHTDNVSVKKSNKI